MAKVLKPQQAAHTRQIVAKAGSKSVCSVCGDEGSRDYKSESDQIAPGAVSSLRLCDDCLSIRNSMHGERFVPFAH